MPSFGGPKHTLPPPPAPKPLSRGEGLNSDLSSPKPRPSASAVLPPPDTPEAWRIALAAKIRILEEEGKQQLLVDYLKMLAQFMEEEADLWAIIQTLEGRLLALESALPGRPSHEQAQIQSAVSTIEGLLHKYNALRAGLRRP